jgi:hypothetical protein
MDLLDRYLHAVRFWLPRTQQNDIIAELGEDIRSQIEEQESKFGRMLTELEVAFLLKERGRPMLVANRYRPQQYLIGPALFPVYRFVLTIVALCYLVPWILTWISLAVFDPHYHTDLGRTFGPLWGTFWVNTFVALGTVTLIFAILERAQPNLKFLKDWNPRDLPAVRDPNRIARLNSTIDVLANGIFLVWWVTDMWSTTIFNRAGVRVIFAPVWKYFLWVFLLIAVSNIILAAINLARPYWTWLRASFHLLLTIAGSVAFCWMCKANLLAKIVASNLSPSRAGEVVNAINANVAKSFPLAVLACVIIVALSGVGRLIRLRTKRPPVMQTATL